MDSWQGEAPGEAGVGYTISDGPWAAGLQFGNDVIGSTVGSYAGSGTDQGVSTGGSQLCLNVPFLPRGPANLLGVDDER